MKTMSCQGGNDSSKAKVDNTVLERLLECSSTIINLESFKHLENFQTILEELLVFSEYIIDNLHDPNNREQLIQIFEYLCKISTLQNPKEFQEKEYGKEEFNNPREAAELILAFIKHIFLKLKSRFLNSEILKSISLPIILICGSHTEEYFWSSNQASRNAHDIIDIILEMHNCSDLETLLCRRKGKDTKHPENLATDILYKLKPCLRKETWEKYITVPFIFKWILLHIKHPFLDDYLSDVLPATFLFMDHHLIQNKILGITCLHHIVNNVPPTDLQMYGRADVIYHALKVMIYINEVPIIEAVHPCTLSFLAAVEGSYTYRKRLQKSEKYWEVYEHLLSVMEMEQRVILRRAYSAFVYKYIEGMGINTVIYMKRSLKVLLEYLSTYCEGPEQISNKNALLGIKALILHTWPRIPFHFEEILKGLLTYICEANLDKKEPHGKEIFPLVKECLSLLKLCCPELFLDLTSLVIKEDLPFVDILKTVIMEPIQPELKKSYISSVQAKKIL